MHLKFGLDSLLVFLVRRGRYLLFGCCLLVCLCILLWCLLTLLFRLMIAWGLFVLIDTLLVYCLLLVRFIVVGLGFVGWNALLLIVWYCLFYT